MMSDQHEDYRPVAWVRGHAIYSTHLIVIFYCVTALVATVVGLQGASELAELLGLSSEKVFAGEIWRILTYGLVNPPGIGFAIDMVIIAWFGREMERFFGRRLFLWFYGALYLLFPVVMTILGFVRPTILVGETGGFALFIAFATLYPGAVFLFNLTAKWLAVIAVGAYSLLAIYARDVVGFASLWASIAFAMAFVRHQQGRFSIPRFRFRQRKPTFRVVPRKRDDDEMKKHTSDFDSEDGESELDGLLDKIARNGLASLSKTERAKLEQAREELLRKERK